MQDQKSVQDTVGGGVCACVCVCGVVWCVEVGKEGSNALWVLFLKLQPEVDPSSIELFEVVELRIPRGWC